MAGTSRTRIGGMVAAVAAAVVVAGCSGGSGWPAAGAASVTPTAPPTTSVATSPAGAADGGAAGGGGAQPASSRCTTAELRGSLGVPDGAAGSVNQTLILTNVGSRTCTLRGFPGVSYVGGEDGHQVGPAAAMSGPRGGDVRLVVGGSVGAQLQLANVQNFDAAACRPTPVRGLRVYPPGDTASLFVPRDGTGCAGTLPGGSSQLSVQTVQAR